MTDTSRVLPEEPVTDRERRTAALLALLAERGRLSVAEAAETLGVSEATIRRDFTALSAQSLVSRTHGGVVAASVAYGLPVRYRSGPSVQDRIARTAGELVEPGEVVGFNGGTTTTLVARVVGGRSDLAATDERPPLTVVTNALNIATELVLRPHVQVVSVGGVARPHSYEVVGPLAHRVLGELWLDHLFLGVDGLDPTAGATCKHEDEAGINALMVERAQQVTVVATSDKLGRRALARICQASSIRRLVTDEGADDAVLAELGAQGIEVVRT